MCIRLKETHKVPYNESNVRYKILEYAGGKLESPMRACEWKVGVKQESDYKESLKLFNNSTQHGFHVFIEEDQAKAAVTFLRSYTERGGFMPFKGRNLVIAKLEVEKFLHSGEWLDLVIINKKIDSRIETWEFATLIEEIPCV